MKVTPVTATLEPYNPQFTNHGVPAEQVNFTVSSHVANFSCKIEVLRSGRIVGTTTVSAGSSPNVSGLVAESVLVEGISGGTFDGTRSNAFVACRAPE